MARLILHLFGSPRMEVDGAPVEVDTRKATALMAYLVISEKPQQRDTLALLLWPDYDQSSARAALRRTLSTLNRALEGQQGAKFLDITRETVGLTAGADLWLDVAEFQRLLASLGAHGHSAGEICPACLEVLAAACALYHEPFMAGFNLRDSPNFEEWQFFQEETLRRELAGALDTLVHGLEASGQSEAAVQYARRWLALDPLLEAAHRVLMQLYANADQRNAALRQYRECVRILDQELGVAPLEETTRLYESILNRQALPGTPGRLRWVDRPAAPATSVAPATAVAPAAAMAPATTVARPLVGRSADTARIRRAYESGGERMAALVGEAGIGKTRLAESFLEWARARGARVIAARCFSGESGLAYAPFIQGLSAALAWPDAAERIRELPAAVAGEAARLLPGITELAAAPIPPPTVDGAQARFFDALRQALQALLRGPQPGILFLDDLHWADQATLDLLAYLAHRLSGAGLFLLCAWRADQNETIQTLYRLASDLARDGRAERLDLQRLDAAEMTELVRGFSGGSHSGPQSEALGQRLYQESEGLPFVAVEYLAALAAQPVQEHWEMPASVRDLLHSRLAQVDSAAQQLLGAAAVIGRSFDFHTLREASGRSEVETVDGLDRLLAAGLVVENAGTDRYDFTHEKLRALVYEITSQARRRLLHRRTAEALAHQPGGRFERAGLAAHHYQQAGQDALAAEYHRLAGERALQLFANVEAVAHFQAALAAGHPDAAGLHESIGDLYTLRGEYTSALTSYQTAAALCTPGCLSNLEHKLGNVHQRLGEWDLAESHYQASLEAAGEPEGTHDDFHVHLYADRCMIAHARGDLEKAQLLAEQALALAQAGGSARALAQAHNVIGVLARARGDQAAASSALEASLRAAESVDDPLARIAALNNLALVYGEMDSTDEAIRLARQALELCQQRGARHREAALHNNLADLLHRCGREEEAMQELKRAVVLFAEIGAPLRAGQAASNDAAEIWKLTEW